MRLEQEIEELGRNDNFGANGVPRSRLRRHLSVGLLLGVLGNHADEAGIKRRPILSRLLAVNSFAYRHKLLLGLRIITGVIVWPAHRRNLPEAIYGGFLALIWLLTIT